jgi:hypothetical protein
LITSLSLLIRFIIANQGLDFLDAFFVHDDTFYTLTISRNIANGFGPSVDSIIQTNGFQPLLCLFQIPLFLFHLSQDQILYGAIYISAFFGGITTFILMKLAYDLSDLKTAVLTGLLCSLCPIVIENDLNGLDTSLAGFLYVLVTLLLFKLDKKRTTSSLILLGFCLTLALLARIDTCFLVMIVGLYIFLKWRARDFLIVSFSALLFISPWWIYSYLHFMSIIPQSGQALTLLSSYYSSLYVSNVFTSLVTLTFWLPYLTYGMSHLETLFPFIFALTLFCAYKGSSSLGRYGLVLLIPLLLLISFYTFYLQIFWYYSRYYYFFYLVFILLLSMTLTQSTQGNISIIRKLSIGIIITFFIAQFYFLLISTPLATQTKKGSLRGFRYSAMHIVNTLKKGTVIGAMQSGALGYYAPNSIRVINLDGVVNPKASEAIQSHQLGKYLKNENITHFYDWEVNMEMLQYFYGKGFKQSCFTLLSTITHRNHALEHYKIDPNC